MSWYDQKCSKCGSPTTGIFNLVICPTCDANAAPKKLGAGSDSREMTFPIPPEGVPIEQNPCGEIPLPEINYQVGDRIEVALIDKDNEYYARVEGEIIRSVANCHATFTSRFNMRLHWETKNRTGFLIKIDEINHIDIDAVKKKPILNSFVELDAVRMVGRYHVVGKVS